MPQKHDLGRACASLESASSTVEDGSSGFRELGPTGSGMFSEKDGPTPTVPIVSMIFKEDPGLGEFQPRAKIPGTEAQALPQYGLAARAVQRGAA